MRYSNFEEALTGGHPNSLGNTVEVVEIVLKNPQRFGELFECYFSDDEVVRLRVSNAMKRIAKENSDLVYGYMDRLLDEISKINQASTQWTLSQLFLEYENKLTPDQKSKALKIMKKNLEQSEDWIVLAQTANTLGIWAKQNEPLKKWLIPRLEKLGKDERKAVASKAKKVLTSISG